MKRSQYRNKNTQSSSQSTKTLIKQAFLNHKQAQRDTTTAAPAASIDSDSHYITC